MTQSPFPELTINANAPQARKTMGNRHTKQRKPKQYTAKPQKQNRYTKSLLVTMPQKLHMKTLPRRIISEGEKTKALAYIKEREEDKKTGVIVKDFLENMQQLFVTRFDGINPWEFTYSFEEYVIFYVATQAYRDSLVGWDTGKRTEAKLMLSQCCSHCVSTWNVDPIYHAAVYHELIIGILEIVPEEMFSFSTFIDSLSSADVVPLRTGMTSKRIEK